ncbi:MAG TPA: hypothetical protein VNZ53_04135 [Steroidobacteraceae bacterium]|jgi:hypothetical protein|nr:hypothetical protein [Steroidobacteraceae bacterium]
MSPPQLPIWVSYLNALAVPLIAAVVTTVGTWVAARQMLIAHDRLRHDEFYRQYERRFAVYEVTRQFLAQVYHGNISDDDIRAYRLHTLDAKFLFDDAMAKYLTDLCHRVAAWQFSKSRADELPSGEEKQEFRRLSLEQLEWIRQQGDETGGFDVRFRRFLVLGEIKRCWLLRWPA